MKKHLIALAVAGAVAAPTMAQNVSLYGALNAAYQNVDTTANANTAVASTGPRSTSILGFTGSEDLGGGMKATFVLEGALNPDDGSTTIGNRKSYLELSGGFGKIASGRIYTADESIEGYSGMGWNIFDADTGEGSTGGKLANSIRYDSPSFMGITVTATTTQAEAVAGAHQNSVGVAYAAGPLYVAAATATRVMSAQTTDDTVNVFAAGYKIGAADLRVTMNNSEANDVKFDYTRVGASMPIGNGVTAVAHWAKGDASTTDTSFDSLGVGIEKALSKRTVLFAAYQSKDFNGAGTDQNTIALGVDHKF